MAARWEAGDHPVVEGYLDRHPELWHQRDAALELIAEELALRHEYGQPMSASELVERFPQWKPQVETLWRCQHAFGSAADAPRRPAPGTEIGGFRLLRELGRGAHGRVFLATQSALGGRSVVLKLAPKTGAEHLSLARLQHSHIVPLYSAHEFPEHGLRGLCLPYFGQTTLSALLARLAESPAPARTGAHLLDALRDIENESPVPLPVGGPTCELIRHASYVEAVCGIGAALADALEYAHSRGLVHLDVKPSNVLIAADGVPMLLDFHLARGPLAGGDAPPAWLGGTPEYMAPELAAAVAAVQRSARVPGAVDGRADIYSLGLLLTEALNPTDVSVGLRAVLARCTAAEPGERYPSAAHLAADLRRHLMNLPLRGVPNRSLVERWRKWRRRRPLSLPCLLVTSALLLLGIGFGFQATSQYERATSALRDGEVALQQERFSESAETFRSGEVLLGGVPFSGSLRGKLRDGQRRAERAQAAVNLHRVCERVRPVYASERVTTDELRTATDRCRELWTQRQQIAANLEGQPTADLERQWRADLLDVGILFAHLRACHAPPDERADAHRQALAILDEAELLLGPSGVLFQERALHARALGLPTLAEEANRQAAALRPQTAWEHLIAGRTFFAAGNFGDAEAEFERCLALDPGSLWGNNYRGLCLLRSRDFAGAVAAFSACVALAPQTAWCHANRGLAHTEAGRLDRADRDFTRALTLDPHCAAALIGRATVHHRSGRFADALSALRSARAAGVPAATIHYHTAAVHLAAGDRAAAAAALRECLVCDPAHAEAQAALARLEGER
jgi:tetratricopeptide (TPR) repeat protein